MQNKQTCGGLDVFRMAAAILVIANHTSPLSSFQPEADFFLTRILARIAVPFFLMITGQFVLSDYLYGGARDGKSIRNSIKKTALLYGLSILLYLPVGIYAGHYRSLTAASLLRMLLIDGTFYHLWYFPACITGILLLCVLSRLLSVRKITVISVFLYVIGLFGDSYYGIAADIPVISSIYKLGFQVFTYTRNGFFLAPVFLLLGARFGQRRSSLSPGVCGIGFLLSLLLMTAEGFLLRHFHIQRHDSMYVFLIPCMYFLYCLLLCRDTAPRKILRTVSAWIYILHPAVIVLVRGLAGALDITELLAANSLIHFIAVCLLSLLFSFCAAFAAGPVWVILLRSTDRSVSVIRRISDRLCAGACPDKCCRAWIELDRNALRKNTETLRSLLPEGCELMPAVKADAYGHGAVLIARELNRLGIRAFCVACAKEGVQLRKHGIKGEILILGYTHPNQFPLLERYRLTQTVVDYSYAVRLNQYKRKLRVHIAVDTGMHRLGERSEHIGELCSMFQMKHLKVDGLYTHLCADETRNAPDLAFTKRQAQNLFQTVGELRRQGYSCPNIHLLASYGVLNYPELAGDYARVGIALYGVLSTQQDSDTLGASLHPVLSLKARIASVRDVYTGETVGYGLQFSADRNMKIAALAIGYADGIPRSLSDCGYVLVNGCKAPVIGRICMDQMMIDVSNIPDVKPRTPAVIIGRSENLEITAGELADRSGTITNELLSRLGARLERIMI